MRVACSRRESFIPIAIDVVVERQLLPLLDWAVGEDAHPDVVSNSPLRHIAVGIAAVVGEPADTATFRSVDILRRKSGGIRMDSGV